MPDALTLPPPCVTRAVIAWTSGEAKSLSLTFTIWEHMLEAGVIVIEPDEDDPNVTHLIYRLDVTPTGDAPLTDERRPRA